MSTTAGETVLDRELVAMKDLVGKPFTRRQLDYWRSRPPESKIPQGTFLKIGHRIYVDKQKFDRWVEQQNPEVSR